MAIFLKIKEKKMLQLKPGPCDHMWMRNRVIGVIRVLIFVHLRLNEKCTSQKKKKKE